MSVRTEKSLEWARAKWVTTSQIITQGKQISEIRAANYKNLSVGRSYHLGDK